MDVRARFAPHGDWTFRALLDTGAPTTVLDRGVADALGIRIGRTGADTGRIKMLGGEWRTQFEEVDLSLVGYEEEWAARVAFVVDPLLQMPFQGVLGSDGFFDRFVVTFNQYYGYVQVELAANVEPPPDTAPRDDDEPFYDPEWTRPTMY